MSQTEWYEVVDIIRPHVVQLSTPSSTGTGFLISHGAGREDVYAVATAAHVVSHAHFWEEPIRVYHPESDRTDMLKVQDRAIQLDVSRDTAMLLFGQGEIEFPDDRLPLTPQGRNLRVGNEIGWLGFPAIQGAQLCFFSGRVSANLGDQDAYLVDGVAINGVSGGPAFFPTGVSKSPVRVMGVVSAYVPNRATGETLPGLSVVRNVEQFHALAKQYATIAQAQHDEVSMSANAAPVRRRRATGAPNLHNQ